MAASEQVVSRASVTSGARVPTDGRMITQCPKATIVNDSFRDSLLAHNAKAPAEEITLVSSKNPIPFIFLCLTLLVVATDGQTQVLTHGGVAPMTKIPPDQWIEKVVGDMDKPGQPFVIRIHHDAGYVVLPHTHPEDENITVLLGSWALGMGSRVNMAEL